MPQDNSEKQDAEALAKALDELSATYKTASGLELRPTPDLIGQSLPELYSEHAEARDSLELACFCLSVSQRNAAVPATQLAFMRPHVEGLLLELHQLERMMLLRSDDGLDLFRATGVTCH